MVLRSTPLCHQTINQGLRRSKQASTNAPTHHAPILFTPALAIPHLQAQIAMLPVNGIQPPGKPTVGRLVSAGKESCGWSGDPVP